MRINTSALVSVVLAFGLSTGLCQNQISVSGSAEVRVAPDEVDIRAGVESRNVNLEEAKHEHDQRTRGALAFLRTAGIPDEDVQTDFVSVEPAYSGDLSNTKPIVYIVRKSIEIKLDSTTNLESILTGLLTNGVSQIHGIEFRTTQLRKYRDRARAMAVHAAKEKAEALAKELEVKCGKPLNINASDTGGWWSWSGNYWGQNGFWNAQNVAQNAGGPSESGNDTLSLGQISVSASVNVAFQIE